MSTPTPAWKIYTTTDGSIAVATPYNPTIIAEAKKRLGRFIDLNIGEGKSVKAWKLDASHRTAMEELCGELFDRAELVERVITWTAVGGYSMVSPTLDGYDMVWFSRGHASVRRFDRGEPLKVLEILEDTLTGGGSARNPRLYGSVTLRVRCRAAAEAAGHDWTVEVE